MKLGSYRQLELPAEPVTCLAYGGCSMDFGLASLISQTQLDEWLKQFQGKPDEFEVYPGEYPLPANQFIRTNIPDLLPGLGAHLENDLCPSYLTSSYKSKFDADHPNFNLERFYDDHLGVAIFLSCSYRLTDGTMSFYNFQPEHYLLLSAALVLQWRINRKNYCKIKKSKSISYLPLMIREDSLQFFTLPTESGLNWVKNRAGGLCALRQKFTAEKRQQILRHIQLMCQWIKTHNSFRTDQLINDEIIQAYLKQLIKHSESLIEEMLPKINLGWLLQSIPKPDKAHDFWEITRPNGKYVKS